MLETESPSTLLILIDSSEVQLDYEQMLLFSQTFKSSVCLLDSSSLRRIPANSHDM
jgi:hypothetical protein